MNTNTRDFNYTIERRIATIGGYGAETKELNLISYAKCRQPKYDLRAWKHESSQDIMLKGITMTREEARALRDALNSEKDL